MQFGIWNEELGIKILKAESLKLKAKFGTGAVIYGG